MAQQRFNSKLEVEVSQEDIDKGCPHPSYCPIARALYRKMETRFLVGIDEIRPVQYNEFWGNDTYDKRATMSEKAIRFVERFDRGEKVRPQKFTFNFK